MADAAYLLLAAAGLVWLAAIYFIVGGWGIVTGAEDARRMAAAHGMPEDEA